MAKIISLSSSEHRHQGPLCPWSHLIVMGLALAGPATMYEMAEDFDVAPFDLLFPLDDLVQLNYLLVAQ